jgi:hypothetical protein
MLVNRRLIFAATTLAFFGGVYLPGESACADEKKEPAKTLLTKSDRLTDKDEKDTHNLLTNSPRKVYKIQFAEGKTYQIDLKSSDFDAVLRLEDAKGKELALNDDYMKGSFDSRILYSAQKAGEYRIIATCLDGKPGKFELSVIETAAQKTVTKFKSADSKLELKDGKAAYSGELTAKDPLVNEHHFKTFSVKLEAGKTYRIDQRSADLDAFLVLEDPLGNAVAQDDDSGGGLNARITYQAAVSGEFRIIATTFESNKTGKFTLDVVTVPGKKDEKKDQSRLQPRDVPLLGADCIPVHLMSNKNLQESTSWDTRAKRFY